MRNWFRRALGAFNALAQRERLLVAVAGGFVTLGLLYLAVVSPILGARANTDRRLVTADQQLDTMTRLRRDFDDVNQRLTVIDQRIQAGRRGNLRTTLETLASKATVKVESMEPQASPSNESYREEKVEVALKSVTLHQTVNYLHQIESAPDAFSVKSLRIRTRPEKPELLDVTFTVSAFEPI